MCLVTRTEKNDSQTNLAYLSTGNFNEKTARTYADHGYFTADKRITSEVKKAFSDLEKGKLEERYRYLWVVPVNMRHRIIKMIDHVRSEEPTSELQPLLRISYAVFSMKTHKTQIQ